MLIIERFIANLIKIRDNHHVLTDDGGTDICAVEENHGCQKNELGR